MVSEKPGRNPNLDLIRVVSIFLVVLLHVNSGQFPRPGDGWWFSNAVNSITRVCVPLFVILSGFLIIPRKDEPLAKHGKRMLRILIALVVWSYIYIAWIMTTGMTFGYQWDRTLTSLLDPTLLLSMARFPVMAHLHFLYALLVLYLFVPVLQGAFDPKRLTTASYYVAICFLASTLSTINSLTGASWLWVPDIGMFALYAGYAMFGAILSVVPLTRTVGLLAAAGYLAATAVTFAVTSVLSKSAPTEAFQIYGSPTVIIASCCAFVALRCIGWPFSQKGGERLSEVAKLTLGIYFIHMLAILFAIRLSWELPLDDRFGRLIFSTILTFALSASAAWLLRYKSFTRWLSPA